MYSTLLKKMRATKVATGRWLVGTVKFSAGQETFAIIDTPIAGVYAEVVKIRQRGYKTGLRWCIMDREGVIRYQPLFMENFLTDCQRDYPNCTCTVQYESGVGKLALQFYLDGEYYCTKIYDPPEKVYLWEGRPLFWADINDLKDDVLAAMKGWIP